MSRGAGMGGLAKFEQPRDPGSHGARTATVGLDDMGEVISLAHLFESTDADS